MVKRSHEEHDFKVLSMGSHVRTSTIDKQQSLYLWVRLGKHLEVLFPINILRGKTTSLNVMSSTHNRGSFSGVLLQSHAVQTVNDIVVHDTLIVLFGIL